MRWISMGVTALLVVGLGYVSADDECAKAKFERTANTVSEVLGSWRELSERLVTMCPNEKASLDREFAASSSDCPIGSRVQPTVAFAHDALEAAVQAGAGLGKCCSSSCAETAKSCSAPEACAMMEARTKLLADLHQLAGYVATRGESHCNGAKSTDKASATVEVTADFCQQKAASLVTAIRETECDQTAAKLALKEIPGLRCEKTAASLVSEIRGTACSQAAAAAVTRVASECSRSAGVATSATAATPKCEKTCEKGTGEVALSTPDCAKACTKTPAAVATSSSGQKGCCEAQTKVAAGCASSSAESLVARGAKLKESWRTARGEFASVSAETLKERHAKANALMAKCDRTRLSAQSMHVLAQGIDALHQIDLELKETAKAHPELLEKIPEDAKKAFNLQCRLIDSVHAVFAEARAAFGGAVRASGEKPKSATF